MEDLYSAAWMGPRHDAACETQFVYVTLVEVVPCDQGCRQFRIDFDDLVVLCVVAPHPVHDLGEDAQVLSAAFARSKRDDQVRIVDEDCRR